MAKPHEINPGDVIYSQIQLDGSDIKDKRLLYVAEVNEKQELTCLNITSAKSEKDHELFKADQLIAATKENGLKQDSYVKTNVEYILSKDNYKFKMEKINLSPEEQKKVMQRYKKMKSQGKVKRADNRYNRNAEFDKMNKQINDLTKEFKQNPELIKDYSQFSARFYQFSPRNISLIYAQNRGATFVASYGDWKNKFGYNVKRNSKAMYILRPVITEYFMRDHIKVPVTQATTEEKVKIVSNQIKTEQDTHFKRYPVYDISQTNCPKGDYPKIYDTGYESIEHRHRYESVKQFALTEGFTVTEKTIDSIALHGYYNPDDNSIVISDKLDDSKKLSVLCHEVSHGLMHRTSTQPTNVKEFEAESLSVMMSERMGVDPDPGSINYISNHFNKIDQEKHPFGKSMERIKKAFDYSDGKIKNIIETSPAYQKEHELEQNHTKQEKRINRDNPKNFINQ